MTQPKRPLKVFLCHASTDKPKVRELYRYLKRRGINPWFDEEHLVGGQDWQVEIPKALATSDAIIICLTKNSVDKEGYIQKEIKFALDKALEMPEGRIFLIPVKFDECEVPFTLSRYQWVDLTVESGYAKMMKALKFRASQLERSIVEVSKKNIEEEDFVRAKKEREAVELAEQERKEKELREKQESEIVEKEEREKRLQIYERQARSLEESGELEKALEIYLEIENINPFVSEIRQKILELQEKIRINKIALNLLRSNDNNKVTANKAKSSKSSAARIAGFASIIFLLLAIFLATRIPSLMKEVNSTASTATPSKEVVSTASLISAASNTPSPTEITDAKDVSMVLVPAGEFTMGDDSFVYSSPAHQVYLDAFWIDQTEVTNAMYKLCVEAGHCTQPSNASHYEDLSYANHPVVYVSRDDAVAYCSWVERRLPTEAEWEKAARGTDARDYPWGNETPNTELLNYSGNVGDTTPVGTYPKGASIYGALDMAGNVWEWVNDFYGDTYYQNSPPSNPQGPNSSDWRVIRGASWDDDGFSPISWNRLNQSHKAALDDLGFRCARSDGQ
ncbi:MAG: SUMF1/EgtB/PvdO family nonheme iron enzyme [Anaerolineae bacterium]|nr:SUMF1/EgtB/PvdO family nonheme iron enzyme [Anaerolineae bacterium]